ncbi:MAG: WXG100 family type VII secretion target, partial [Angustibacter sp.]
MSDIKISHERMASEANNLKAVRGQLDETLSALRTKIQQLVTDGFVTQSASQSFNEAHERWNT